MALGVLYEITIEATNPRALAHFWQAMIGGEVDVDDDDWASLDNDEVFVVFVRTNKRAAGKNGVSLTVEVDDLGSATGLAEDLGAAREGPPTEADDTRRQTMTDPSGHLFTLVCNA